MTRGDLFYDMTTKTPPLAPTLDLKFPLSSFEIAPHKAEVRRIGGIGVLKSVGKELVKCRSEKFENFNSDMRLPVFNIREDRSL